MTFDRRDILKLTAAAAGLSALTPQLARALRAPLQTKTGTLADVEHIVIFMQENRSFDHYFGSLRGVRGFADPRALSLPGGGSVFAQPMHPGAAETVLPFHLDTQTTAAQVMASLDHSWKGSQETWRHWDCWIKEKSPLTMGYFTRADLPFYYALADAFTLCDAYHCSIFGPTNPNRLFLMTGTNGLSAGQMESVPCVANPPDEPNETADLRNDSSAFAALQWTTYPERLTKAGVSWRLYQEFDNYGDNALAYFEQFRAGAPDANIAAARSWVAGSNAANAKASHGEHLVAAFAEDVKADRLAKVSWIVAPYIACEHPKAAPAYGAALTGHLLEALAANPEVFAKTVFLLTYDENDGFFDHVPPAVPALNPEGGANMIGSGGERYFGVPVGFGPRVPMLAVSPWSRGGFVNSQLADHTSIIRFLERRFGVKEPNISPWRRAMAGDLTSLFDFANTAGFPTLPAVSGYVAEAGGQATLPPPQVPKAGAQPSQEPGQRPARAIPYDFDVVLSETGLRIVNRGAGTAFTLYAAGRRSGPWPICVAANATQDWTVAVAGAYELHGPNGFYRAFVTGSADIVATARAAGETLELTLRNGARQPLPVTLRDHHAATQRTVMLPPAQTRIETIAIAQNDHWYDLSVTAGTGPAWRFAGHVETGRPSRSDPAIGRG